MDCVLETKACQVPRSGMVICNFANSRRPTKKKLSRTAAHCAANPLRGTALEELGTDGKHTDAQVIKEFRFYGTRRSVTVFARTIH
jgi:hypothetical protein